MKFILTGILLITVSHAFSLGNEIKEPYKLSPWPANLPKADDTLVQSDFSQKLYANARALFRQAFKDHLPKEIPGKKPEGKLSGIIAGCEMGKAGACKTRTSPADYITLSLADGSLLSGTENLQKKEISGKQIQPRLRLSGATVTLKSKSQTYSAITGPSGEFLFDAVVPGLYYLTAAHPNYEDQRNLPVTVDDLGQVKTVLLGNPDNRAERGNAACSFRDVQDQFLESLGYKDEVTYRHDLRANTSLIPFFGNFLEFVTCDLEKDYDCALSAAGSTMVEVALLDVGKVYSVGKRLVVVGRPGQIGKNTKLTPEDVKRLEELIRGAGVSAEIWPKNLVEKTGEFAERWLGKHTQIITNSAGDKIFLSKDGMRRLRFDIKNPHGDLPHAHIETKRGSRWIDAGSDHRIYFQGEKSIEVTLSSSGNKFINKFVDQVVTFRKKFGLNCKITAKEAENIIRNHKNPVKINSIPSNAVLDELTLQTDAEWLVYKMRNGDVFLKTDGLRTQVNLPIGRDIVEVVHTHPAAKSIVASSEDYLAFIGLLESGAEIQSFRIISGGKYKDWTKIELEAQYAKKYGYYDIFLHKRINP